MRNEFSQAIEKIALQDEKIIFLTGDLGYKALENLQEKLGNRFINTGVAEQNMVGVAAGMAHKGFKVFCYSIAPFVVYRCLEQFRNDVCLHNLPVFLVGNGGGYGYGIMGSTHHAIEDLACLSGLQNVTCWIPAFSDEVAPFITQIVAMGKPSYLRLGMGKTSPQPVVDYGSVKLVKQAANPKASVVALGSIANNVLAAIANEPTFENVQVFEAYQLPLAPQEAFYEQLATTKRMAIAEEHVSVGGLAQQLSVQLLRRNLHFEAFECRVAVGYPDGLYGSQQFHQRQSGLAIEQLNALIGELLEA